MKINSYAKINLGLHILGKRNDGFHELETLMHEIDLCDEIEISSSLESKVSVKGIEVETDQNNLILKSLRALKGHFPEQVANYSFALHKKIPLGSGMGGGSSNAISVLNYLWDECIGLPNDTQLKSEIASSLGSDTNFFLKGGTAICRGRGENVELLKNKSLYFILILPEIFCATPEVFSRLDINKLNGGRFSLSEQWEETQLPSCENDLMAPCFEAYPELGSLYKEIRSVGWDVKLSGSGSTLFLVSDSIEERDENYNELSTQVFSGLQYKLLKAHSHFRDS